MTLTFYTLSDRAKHELNNRKLALGLINFPDSKLVNLYKKYLKLKDSIKKIEDINSLFPELSEFNKKLNLDRDSFKLFNLVENVPLMKLEKINNSQDYLMYMLQYKLGLVKQKLPGVNKIEKELNDYKNSAKSFQEEINNLVKKYDDEYEQLYTKLSIKLHKLSDDELIKLKTKYKLIDLSTIFKYMHDGYHYPVKDFLKILPDLEQVSKKLELENPLIVINLIDNAYSVNLRSINNKYDYVTYLVQRKLGIVKVKLPGVDKIENELGVNN